jgi:hypothetical protein
VDPFIKNLRDIAEDQKFTVSESTVSIAAEAFVRTLLSYDRAGHKTLEGTHPICVCLKEVDSKQVVPTSSQWVRFGNSANTSMYLPGGLYPVPEGQYRVYVKETVIPTAKGYVKTLIPTHYVKFKVEASPGEVRVKDIAKYHLCAHDDIPSDGAPCARCKGSGLYRLKVP